MKLNIKLSVRSLLEQNDFVSLASFMEKPAGELLDYNEQGRELRRLTFSGPLGTERFYLKRSERESIFHMARMLLYGHRPHPGPLRELLLLKRLRQAGFATMEPVAWGGVHNGFSCRGFLLVREVPGVNVADIFDQLAEVERLQLTQQIGFLIGRLHSSGFYQPVRLKDLILTSAAGQNRSLVLIDRETSKPWPSTFSPGYCLSSLARSSRRTLRDGHRLAAPVIGQFVRGYTKGVEKRWDIRPKHLLERFQPVLLKELG